MFVIYIDIHIITYLFCNYSVLYQLSILSPHKLFKFCCSLRVMEYISFKRQKSTWYIHILIGQCEPQFVSLQYLVSARPSFFTRIYINIVFTAHWCVEATKITEILIIWIYMYYSVILNGRLRVHKQEHKKSGTYAGNSYRIMFLGAIFMVWCNRSALLFSKHDTNLLISGLCSDMNLVHVAKWYNLQLRWLYILAYANFQLCAA